MLSRSTSRYSGGLLWLMAAVSIIYAAGYVCFPTLIDCGMFDRLYLDANGGSSAGDFRGWLRYCAAIHHYDNCRIAQLIAPLISYVPWVKYAVALVLGVCTTITIGLTARLTFGRVTTATFSAIWLILTLILPWRNWLVSELYALNYVLPGVFALWSLWLLRKGDVGFNLPSVLVALALCCWGHESMGVAMACGFAGWLILRGSKAGWRWWVATLFTAALSILLIFGAGMRHRAGVELTANINGYKLWLELTVHFLFWLLAALYLWCLCRKKSRRQALDLLRQPMFVVAAASSMTLVVADLFTNCQSRQGYLPQLFSLIALAMLMKRYYHLPRLQAAAVHRLTWVFVAVLCLFWSAVAYVQYHKGQEYYAMHERILQQRSGKVYMHLDWLQKSEPWLLNIPMRNLINYDFDTYCLGMKYPEIDSDSIVVVYDK